MKTNSNSYTIIYSVIIVVIVAFLLAFVSSSLKTNRMPTWLLILRSRF